MESEQVGAGRGQVNASFSFQGQGSHFIVMTVCNAIAILPVCCLSALWVFGHGANAVVSAQTASEHLETVVTPFPSFPPRCLAVSESRQRASTPVCSSDA